MPERYETIDGICYAASVEIAAQPHRRCAIVRKDNNGRFYCDLTFDTGKRSAGNLPEGSGARGTPESEAEPDAPLKLFLLDDEGNP